MPTMTTRIAIVRGDRTRQLAGVSGDPGQDAARPWPVARVVEGRRSASRGQSASLRRPLAAKSLIQRSRESKVAEEKTRSQRDSAAQIDIKGTAATCPRIGQHVLGPSARQGYHRQLPAGSVRPEACFAEACVGRIRPVVSGRLALQSMSTPCAWAGCPDELARTAFAARGAGRRPSLRRLRGPARRSW